MAELWLLRHGATAWAQEGRHTGRTDLPLLPEGEAEARRLGEQAQLCDDLLEWNYGAYEGITTATIRETVPGWTVWSHGCPDGEDSAAVQLRCERVIALAETLAAGSASPRVALVAHGHILRWNVPARP